MKDVLYKGVNDDITYQNISGEVVLNNKDAAAKELKVSTGRKPSRRINIPIKFPYRVENTRGSSLSL